MLTIKRISTPIGDMIAGATDQGVCLLDFPYRKMIGTIMKRGEGGTGSPAKEGNHQFLDELQEQLGQYFSGLRKEFQLPMHLIGSPFQLKVWEGLKSIPYGATRSYKAQSVFLGDEKAIRAVARANGENGLAILVPCHRVIGENGSLVGYAGGLGAKQKLLELERHHSGQTQQQSLFKDGSLKC